MAEAEQLYSRNSTPPSPPSQQNVRSTPIFQDSPSLNSRLEENISTEKPGNDDVLSRKGSASNSSKGKFGRYSGKVWFFWIIFVLIFWLILFYLWKPFVIRQVDTAASMPLIKGTTVVTKYLPIIDPKKYVIWVLVASFFSLAALYCI
jgi:hypothetical protein